MDQKPSIGGVVHYTSYGTPGGEFGRECRAAIVTEVSAEDPSVVGLCVLNPTGLFLNQGVAHDDGSASSGDPDCPSADVHGVLMCECRDCDWKSGERQGGTWHWPERF